MLVVTDDVPRWSGPSAAAERRYTRRRQATEDDVGLCNTFDIIIIIIIISSSSVINVERLWLESVTVRMLDLRSQDRWFDFRSGS